MSATPGMVIGAAPSWRPREADRWTGPGLWLALGVHGLLLLALAVSMNWKMSDTSPVEAEVWSEIPQVAGGAVPPPPPAPREEPREMPVTRPEPVKAVDPEPEPQRPPDLVVAKIPPKSQPKPPPKKVEPVPEPKPEPPKKVEPKKPEPKKPEPKKPEPEKPVKAEKPADKPVKPSPVTDPKSRTLSAAELEAQRQANLQRMMSSLGGGGAGPGTAARSAGPSAGYAGRIVARVKPNIVFTEAIPGNPQAVVEVRCAPDGRIVSRRLVTSSGVSSWDDAVLRALDRTEVLPADVDGRVPSLMQLSFKPRDF